MGGDGAGQSFQIVAAFHHRDDPAVARALGDIHQLARGPGKIRLGELQFAERVAVMN